MDSLVNLQFLVDDARLDYARQVILRHRNAVLSRG